METSHDLRYRTRSTHATSDRGLLQLPTLAQEDRQVIGAGQRMWVVRSIGRLCRIESGQSSASEMQMGARESHDPPTAHVLAMTRNKSYAAHGRLPVSAPVSV